MPPARELCRDTWRAEAEQVGTCATCAVAGAACAIPVAAVPASATAASATVAVLPLPHRCLFSMSFTFPLKPYSWSDERLGGKVHAFGVMRHVGAADRPWHVPPWPASGSRRTGDAVVPP